jgi:hypothetical protein
MSRATALNLKLTVLEIVISTGIYENIRECHENHDTVLDVLAILSLDSLQIPLHTASPHCHLDCESVGSVA